MKYISVDYIVDICQANIIPLKAHRQSVAVSALRRVMEAVKEDCVEAEQIIHAHWEINPDGYYPYCSNCKSEPKGCILHFTGANHVKRFFSKYE